MNSRRSYDPGPLIAHAGGINLGTENLEKSLWFFRDLLGMEVTAEAPGVAYLRGHQEKVHHSLVLTQQTVSTINTLSFRVARPQDVELFHDQFVEEDIDVRTLSAGAETGRGEAIRFLMPGSEHPVELYYDIEKPLAPAEISSTLHGNSARRRGLGVQRFDHHNVSTSMETAGVAESWLRESLGMKRREFMSVPGGPGVPDMVAVSWLSVNSKLHDIAIGGNPSPEKARFHHVAFALDSISDVLVAADQLRDHGIQIDAGPGRHGVGQAMYLYVRDPGSGHRIEIYSGGYSFFDPDHAPTEWRPEDMRAGMTWVGDLPDLNPETSTYTTTTATSGLELPNYDKAVAPHAAV